MAGMTLAEFFIKQFGSYPDIGDKTEWHGLTWVVAEIDNGWIQKLGLRLPELPDE